jgi:hypothetical protein
MSLNKIYEIVVLITFLYSIYLLLFKKKSKEQFYLYLYLLIVILVDIVPVNFPNIIKINRNLLFVGYIIFSLLFFSNLYQKNISNRNFKVLNFIIIISLIILNINSFQFENKDKINFIPIISLPILFIYLSISWYLFKLKNVNEAKITDDFLFWISSGILIWSVFFIFRAIPMYFLQDNDPKLLSLVITVFSVVNIIMYILFLIGLIFIKNERTSRRI